jgi:hypothetical protein
VVASTWLSSVSPRTEPMDCATLTQRWQLMTSRPFRWRPIVALLCSIAMFMATPPATASPILFEFSGTVIRVVLLTGATDTLGYSAGQNINGSFTFDDSVIDSDASGASSFRPWSIRSFSFDAIAANMNYLNYSYFNVDANPLADGVGAYALEINQQVANLFTFTLVQGGPTAVLGSDSVDLTQLRLSDFDPSDSRFEYRHIEDLPAGQRRETVIVTSIDSLTVQRVPEPGTLALLALGLAGLGWSRRARSAMLFTSTTGGTKL